MDTADVTETAAGPFAGIDLAGVPMGNVIQISIGIFTALILFYVVLVLFKNRIVGSRGDFLRVVDQVAVTQTSRIALVELAGCELFVVGINSDRIYPIATVTNEKVLKKVLPREGGSPTRSGDG